MIFYVHRVNDYMPDNKTTKGPRDAARINVEEDYEMQYWTETLRVTPEELRKAVQEVGPMVENVKKYLNKASSK